VAAVPVAAAQAAAVLVRGWEIVSANASANAGGSDQPSPRLVPLPQSSARPPRHTRRSSRYRSKQQR
jgi:hypothetical protein